MLWIMLAFCTSPRFVEHLTGPEHPERPNRIRAIARAVRQAGLIGSPDPFPDFTIDMGNFEPIAVAGRRVKPLLEIEAHRGEERWVQLVHDPAYIDHVRHVSALGRVLDQGDTPTSPASYETAMLAVGAVLGACEAVVGGKAGRAFCAIRPPGHHAEPDRPMGFCLFSNIAIAARYLQKHHGVGKIAVVDFDVHHGNGTQAVFESDPSVFFASIHQDPRTCYPGTGDADETGMGAGRGFTLNIPLGPGGGDEEYRRAMDEQVIGAVERFKPDFLLISAGFDAHRDDPLAQMNVSEDGFADITRSLVQLAERCCGGKIVSVLEGGYHLRALGRSVVKHLIEMT